MPDASAMMICRPASTISGSDARTASTRLVMMIGMVSISSGSAPTRPLASASRICTAACTSSVIDSGDVILSTMPCTAVAAATMMPGSCSAMPSSSAPTSSTDVPVRSGSADSRPVTSAAIKVSATDIMRGACAVSCPDRDTTRSPTAAATSSPPPVSIFVTPSMISVSVGSSSPEMLFFKPLKAYCMFCRLS